MKKTGKALAKFYKVPVKSAYYHVDGNWYWNLSEFPAAYFDANGCIIFQNESDYFQCVYLSIGPENTGRSQQERGNDDC